MLLLSSWNHNLSAIRQRLFHEKELTGKEKKHIEDALKSMIGRWESLPKNFLAIEQTITFCLQYISLDQHHSSPYVKAKMISKLFGWLKTYLMNFKIVHIRNPAFFFDYFVFFSQTVTQDTLLYVFLNLKEKKYKTWILGVKKKLLKLIYECQVLHFKSPYDKLLQKLIYSWCILGVIKEKEELLQVLNITLNRSNEQFDYKFQSEMKYFGSGPEGKKVAMVYTGKYWAECQYYMEHLTNKKEELIEEYIQYFYELLIIFRSKNKQRGFFDSELDCLSFHKSYVYSMVEYFFINMNRIGKVQSFIALWDVLRLSSSYLSVSNKKQLLQQAEKHSSKMDEFAYNIDFVMKCIKHSFGEGKILFLDLEESAVKLLPLEIKALANAPTAIAINAVLNQIFQRIMTFFSIQKNKLKVEQSTPIKLQSIEKNIVEWTNSITSSPKVGFDELKMLGRLLLALKMENFLPSEYSNLRTLLQKKLEEEKGLMAFSQKDINSEIKPIGELKFGDTKEEIDRFIKANEHLIIRLAEKKLTLIVNDFFDSAKPSGDLYREISLMIKRLGEALQLDPDIGQEKHKLKLIGSAGTNLLAAKGHVSCTLIIDSKIGSDPYPYLIKICEIIKKANIGNPKIIMIYNVNKIVFEDTSTKLTYILSFNDILSLQSTLLISTYLSYDERVRKLMFFLKSWAGKNNLLVAGVFSTYLLELLIIQYMQIMDPPLLPPLQQLFLTKPQGTKEITKVPISDSLNPAKAVELIEVNTYFEQKTDKVRAYMSKLKGTNIVTLGGLVREFFKFYGYSFAHQSWSINIREGKLCPKEKQDMEAFTVFDPFIEKRKLLSSLAVGTPEFLTLQKAFVQAYFNSLQNPNAFY